MKMLLNCFFFYWTWNAHPFVAAFYIYIYIYVDLKVTGIIMDKEYLLLPSLFSYFFLFGKRMFS